MIYLTLLYGAQKTLTMLIIRREISSYSFNNISTLEHEFKPILMYMIQRFLPYVLVLWIFILCFKSTSVVLNAPDRTMEISLINFYFYTIRVHSATPAFLNLIFSTRLSSGMRCNLRFNFIGMKFHLLMLFFYSPCCYGFCRREGEGKETLLISTIVWKHGWCYEVAHQAYSFCNYLVSDACTQIRIID